MSGVTPKIKFKDLDFILLVDDDDATNFIHERAIRKSKIDVRLHAVSNGRMALDYLRQAPLNGDARPGIVFIDLNMPVMNGWEFLHKYKDLPAGQKADMLVVMLGVGLNAGDHAHAEASGVVDIFLPKPLTKESFLKTVQSRFKEQAITE